MKKFYVFPQRYQVSFMVKGVEIFDNSFTTFTGAIDWATNKLRDSKICDVSANIVSTKTGEIMLILSR